MSLKRDPSGRLHIDTPLMAESLMDQELLERTQTDQLFRALPTLSVIKLGGQSIIDRGRAALMPLIEEASSGSLTFWRSESWSSGWGPDVTFCIIAASATLRVSGPQ